MVIIDSRSSSHDSATSGILAKLAFTPVIGDALWRIKPDFSVRQGLEVAFAPGFDVPDAFVEDVDRMTYTAYDSAAADDEDYTDEETLAERVDATGKPLLVIMGAEEQIIDEPAGGSLNSDAEAVPDAPRFSCPASATRPTSRTRRGPRCSCSALQRQAKDPAKDGKRTQGCKPACRNAITSEGSPSLRTHVRF